MYECGGAGMVRKQMRRNLMTAVILLLVMVCFCAQAAQSFPFTTVTTVSVNMRRTASSTGTVLDRLKEGESVTVTGESGNYYKVSYGNRTGYILKTYLSTDPAVIQTPVPTEQPTASSYPYETVATEKVNLREKASKNSDILGHIPQGDTVTVHSATSSWAKVTWKDREGYVSTEFLVMKKIVKPTPTPKPTAKASTGLDLSGNANAYSLLTPGSVGNDVLALQEALKELGFYTGNATGSYDSATEKAVIAFQKKNKYPETGLMDPNIMAFLFSGKPLNSKGEKTSVSILAPVDGVTVRAGNRGELVSRIQVRLYGLGYYKGEITGTYDAATRSAVKAFQKANGLNADALAGVDTQALLFSDEALAAGQTPAPTASPTPTPAPALETPSATVQQGSSGYNAKLVQQRLIDLGYLKGKADGAFGSDSAAALKAFQKASGLNADGKAGAETIALLFSRTALSAGATPTPAAAAATATVPPVPTATPTAEPITEDNVVTIRLGSSGQAVERLQRRLTELGYYEATVDGVCKADDVAAIRTFQQLNRLKDDGVAGLDTQTVLYSDKAVGFTAVTAQPTIEAGTALRLGDTGDSVKTLQERLITLKYLFGKPDGVFGTATEDALAAFQKANGLTADGVAGAKTLEKLYSASAKAASTKATATPAPTSATTLQRGDKSTEVKRMQQRLIELGYLTGKADGTFGAATYEALVAFQKANRLKADGIAGSSTLSVLESATAVSASATAGTATATPKPTAMPAVNLTSSPTAGSVRYANWYSMVKSVVQQYPYATIYDFKTGISWQVHIFSTGAHADAEPLTAKDTANLVKAFGSNTWTPKAVWVVLSNGQVYMASTHSMPHEVQHITDNNFNGHLCIHFPRTEEQVEAIGPYATSHQKAIDEGWATTQKLAGK